MRTTLDIDADILKAAKVLAEAERKTMGQVLSELVRKGMNACDAAPRLTGEMKSDGPIGKAEPERAETRRR